MAEHKCGTVKRWLLIAFIAINVLSPQLVNATMRDRVRALFTSNQDEQAPSPMLPNLRIFSGPRASADIFGTSLHEAAPFIGEAIDKMVTGALQGAGSLVSNVVGRGRVNKLHHGTYQHLPGHDNMPYNDMPSNSNSGQGGGQRIGSQSPNGQFGQPLRSQSPNGQFGQPLRSQSPNGQFGQPFGGESADWPSMQQPVGQY